LLNQITGVAISSLHAKMANVSRKICAVMVTLHVKMNQTKTIVNALPACLPVRGGNAFRQQMCATEKTTALTEMTKTIAGIHAILDISVLMDLVFPGQIHVVKQVSAETELARLLYAGLESATSII